MKTIQLVSAQFLLVIALTACQSIDRKKVIADIPKVMKNTSVDNAIAVLGKPSKSSKEEDAASHSVTFFRPPIQIQIDYSSQSRLIESIFVSNMFSLALPEKSLKEYTGLTGDTDLYWLEVGESPNLRYITITPGVLSKEQKYARYLRTLPSDHFEMIKVRIPVSAKEMADMKSGQYKGTEFRVQLNAIQSTIEKHGLGRMAAWISSSGDGVVSNSYAIEVLDASRAIPLLSKALKKTNVPKGTVIEGIQSSQTTNCEAEQDGAAPSGTGQ